MQFEEHLYATFFFIIRRYKSSTYSVMFQGILTMIFFTFWPQTKKNTQHANSWLFMMFLSSADILLHHFFQNFLRE